MEGAGAPARRDLANQAGIEGGCLGWRGFHALFVEVPGKTWRWPLPWTTPSVRAAILLVGGALAVLALVPRLAGRGGPAVRGTAAAGLAASIGTFL